MIVVATLATALTVWWALPDRRTLLSRVQLREVPERAGPSRRVLRSAGAVAAHLALSLLAGLLGAPVAGVVCWCLGALALTGAHVVIARRDGRRALSSADEVARGCAVLAAECRLGRVPAEALRVTADSVEVYRNAAGLAQLGGDLIGYWREQATRPGCGGLAALAEAWQVSTVTGAALTPSLESVAQDLRARYLLRRVVDGELAAPRATSHVLAALPFAGLLLGHVVGAQPIAFLLGSPVGLIALTVGTALTCAGVLWSELLAAWAARPEGGRW